MINATPSNQPETRIVSLAQATLSRAPLLIILAVFSCLALYNSAVLPLGEAPDETDHYQYLRFVARTGHPPFTPAERKEAGFKGGLAPLYYWLTAWPIALVGADTPPDIRRVDGRPERFIPTDGLGINRLVHTLDERWPWRGQPLAWHLVRLLSLPMAWVTILASYALARRLFPNRKMIALGAAAFVAFLPRFVISSAVINDDNLVFALTALLLLVQVMILQGDRRPGLFALFGLLFGLALVTKYFSLILVPEVLFTLFIAFTRPGPRSPHAASGPTGLRFAFFAFLLAFLLTAGLWFSLITIRFNRIDELGLIPGLAASLGEPQITEGLVGLLSGQSVRPVAATYSLPAWFSLLFRSFWFEYGWMKIFAPTWVYGLFTIFLLVGLAGLLRNIVRYAQPQAPKDERRVTPGHQAPPTVWLLLTLRLTLFIIVVLARYILSATVDTGQGRHLYPALPVMALALSAGLQSVWSGLSLRASTRWSRRLLQIAGYAFILICFLNPALIALTPRSFILPHYQTLPVTSTPPAGLTIDYRHNLPVTGAISFAGFDAPATVAAGSVLPVTLYWQSSREVNQDYLVSLCLRNDRLQPVACVRSHFVNGHYLARAWEGGDTLADPMFIPLPSCSGLIERPYRLHLELWPLHPDSLTPQVEAEPVLQQTFDAPTITIRPAESVSTGQPQTVDFWLAAERLSGSQPVSMNEAVTQISYAAPANILPSSGFETTGTGPAWLPLSQFKTPLHLPCDDDPLPFATAAHYIADASRAPGVYRPSANLNSDLTLSLFNRFRTFAPLTATLSFSDTLSPLTLEIPPGSAIDVQSLGLQSPVTNYQLPQSELPVTIRWQSRRWMADPLVISLKLLDKDFAVGGERIATLGDRYPNILWAPTETIEETYPLQLKPDAPPGLYQLELSLIRQDKRLPDGFEYLPLVRDEIVVGQNLNPLTVRLLDPAHNTPPQHPFSAQLGSAIQLTGYDLSPESPVSLTLYWRSTAAPATDYTIFSQLLGPDGHVWAQWDNPPQAGRYPTSAWPANDRVLDRYQLSLNEGAPPGDYRLVVGMYDPATGQRLPAFIDGRPQPHNALELATLSLTP